MIQSACLLERAGAEFIIMPCHTAHLWIKELRGAVTIPFLSIVENTVQSVLKLKKGKKEKILLLASATTINSSLYQDEFANTNITIITPLPEEQHIVDNAIREVKGGLSERNQYIRQIDHFLMKYKAGKVSTILGCCTEIPLMYPYLRVRMEMLDPTLMLAKAAVSKAAF